MAGHGPEQAEGEVGECQVGTSQSAWTALPLLQNRAVTVAESQMTTFKLPGLLLTLLRLKVVRVGACQTGLLLPALHWCHPCCCGTACLF